MKKIFLTGLVLLIMAVVFTGCAIEIGSLSVLTQAPSEFKPFVLLVKPEHIKVTAVKGDTTFSRKVSYQETAEVLLDPLQTGNWTVNVSVIDSKENVVLQGSEVVNVESGATIDANIDLQMLKGTLNINVTFPQGMAAASAKATLVNYGGGGYDLVNNLQVGAGSATGAFTVDAKTNCKLQVTLFDANYNELYTWPDQTVTILPGQAVNINLAVQ